MPTAYLTDRALVSVSGQDAEHLLQNVITTDLAVLAPGAAKPGALLTPQGKILFDFLISRAGNENFLLECRADIANELARRLTLYRLRAKAEITVRDQKPVRIVWQAGSGASDSDPTDAGRLRDLRFAEPAEVWRDYPPAQATDGEPAAWHAFRIANGIAESGGDYALGEAFPHDVLLDQTGGVGLRKGCYVGQEVVSRMQHRGTARRRVLIATAEGALPPTGTDILAGGRTIGTLGSSAGTKAIAIARIDKVKAAMDSGLPMMAGNATLALAIPAWARFTFPRDPPAEEA
jgi:folate-binding protein YgfZ